MSSLLPQGTGGRHCVYNVTRMVAKQEIAHYAGTVLMLLLLFGYASAGFATDSYVSPSGSDSNDGSAAHPWRTIQHAATMAQAGMTIHVAAGLYNEHVVSTVSGTATAPITFISDSKWGAQVVGSGCSAVAPAYECSSGFDTTWLNKGDYVNIRGFDITGDGHIGIQNDAANVQELNNHVHNIAGPGACIGYTGGIAGIDNTNANSPDATLKYNNVIGNWIHDIAWIGTFCGSGGHGVYQASPGGMIQNNLLYRGSGQGVTMWHFATNVIITNNTIFQFGDGIVVGADPSTGIFADFCMVNNNIIRSVAHVAIREEGAVGTHNFFLSNLIYQTAVDYALESNTKPAVPINADPLFVNWSPTGAGDYHLKSGSPAIDAGTLLGAPPDDFDGVLRPQGKAVDCGAYEYVPK